MDVWEEAKTIRVKTERDNRAAVEIWTGGINRLVRALDPLKGYKLKHPEVEQVQLALLAHAVNTQLAGYFLAVQGYCLQALPLVRRSAEDWLAWWYIRNFPKRSRRFLDVNEKSPDWNEMVQGLELRHPERGGEQEVRNWRKWLNQLSHVDRIAVRLTWDDSSLGASLRVGPVYDSRLFDECAGEFAIALPPLIEAADVMCLICGVRPTDPGGVMTYHDELVAWLRMVDADLGELN